VNLAVQTLPPLELDGLGEEDALRRIQDSAEAVLKQGRFLLGLGGEHTVTVPLVRAAKKIIGDVTVLFLDAHLDLREEYGGTIFSHACTARRLVEEGIRTVHVGTRSCSAAEHAFAKEKQMAVFRAGDIGHGGGTDWMERVVEHLSGPVYVSVDMDVFDPSLVPGTGTPEPGGPGWRRVTRLLRRVFEARDVAAADIVELSPVPGTHVSEFVAARLGAKMLLYHSRPGA